VQHDSVELFDLQEEEVVDVVQVAKTDPAQPVVVLLAPLVLFLSDHLVHVGLDDLLEEVLEVVLLALLPVHAALGLVIGVSLRRVDRVVGVRPVPIALLSGLHLRQVRVLLLLLLLVTEAPGLVKKIEGRVVFGELLLLLARPLLLLLEQLGWGFRVLAVVVVEVLFLAFVVVVLVHVFVFFVVLGIVRV
jgi:hypothetical protein